MRHQPIPTRLRGLAVRTRDLPDHGLTYSRSRALDVMHPHHGVVAFDAPLRDTEDRCRAYEPILLPGQVFSHRTAARLWGMWLPGDAAEEPLDVAVLAPRTPPRRPGVRGWKLPHISATMLRGFPIVDAAQAWCQLGALLGIEDLVAAGEALLPARRRIGITSLERLRAAVERQTGRPGAGLARRALPRLREGVGSRPESLLRQLIVHNGLPEPVVQHPVRVSDEHVLHPDLAYPDLRLAIEYEGDGHRTSPRQWRHDIWRREVLEEVRWRTMRVTSVDLFETPHQTLERLRRSRARGELDRTELS